MTSDRPHMFVGIREGQAASISGQGNDYRSFLMHSCTLHLPPSVQAEVVSSTASLDWSVFRHSVAPYLRDFDLAEQRTLLRLSLVEGAKQRSALNEAAELARGALALSLALPADVICWPYAQLVSGIDQVKDSIARFSAGQDVPVLEFVRMTLAPGNSLASTGLYYFCGQEIRLQSIGEMSPAGLVRRACRIAADAMLHGPYKRTEAVSGLAPGEQIEIRPEPKSFWRRRPQWLSVRCDVRSAVLSGMDV